MITSFIGFLNTILNSNKYISATLILILFFFLAKLVVKVIEKIFMRLAAKTKTKVDDDIVLALRNPASLLILLVGFKLFFVELWSVYGFQRYVDFTLDSVIIMVTIFTGVKILNIMIEGWGLIWAQRTKSSLDDQLLRLLHQVVTGIAYVFGVLWILSIWGIEIGPLLAGLGIGGLAIAFALQPTLANIFGGVSLILDKTIKVGDVVKLSSGESGAVYDIGIRSTRIKTWTNQILVIPNSKLVDSMVINYNQPDRTIRIDLLFGVAYGSNIDKVVKIAMDTLKGEKFVLKDPAAKCWFMNMADSALEFKMMFYVDDLSNKWTTHQSVIKKLYNALNKNKINIPFPQREIWVHNVKKK